MASATSGSEPDRGLLAILRELEHDLDAPPTTRAVAKAAGIPDEYTRYIEERLEQNRKRGLVLRCGNNYWLLTTAGSVAAAR
jgi:hypothetical protein